jgi:hypothetical protein
MCHMWKVACSLRLGYDDGTHAMSRRGQTKMHDLHRIHGIRGPIAKDHGYANYINK